VPKVITGSAVAGQELRNVASRNAFEATWCASMMPAVPIATVVSAVGFTIRSLSMQSPCAVTDGSTVMARAPIHDVGRVAASSRAFFAPPA
jgi:hypothetical protein